MELRRVPTTKRGLSSDYIGDPEEKEVSEGEDEDDDRNHKHRRRDTRSQSSEPDSLDQVFTRPYRKRNRPFENGYTLREGGSQSGETWKDFTSRFEKRRPNPIGFSRNPLDLSHRVRGNQLGLGEAGAVRGGRGREAGSWGPRDAMGGSVDITGQLVQPASLFPGRGLPNAHGTSWNAFGLGPGIPNGGLDPPFPLGLQGTFGPSLGPPVNIGVPRQRCIDFEEQGFCLRGDMCPMEHGMNRIVVEDVQSLSQFNLPVSLPGSQLLGPAGGQGPLPAIITPSGTLMSTSLNGKNSKSVMPNDGLDSNGGFIGDVYDPDQPLWANDRPETSSALLAHNADEPESFSNIDLTQQHRMGFSEALDDERPQSTSVWGRIGGSKNRSGVKDRLDSALASTSHPDKSDSVTLNMVSQDAGYQGKRVNESSRHLHNDVRRPPHKALRTLFVSGIPQKDNRKEALHSHFRKFGEVVDIYIPSNSERAFVQFSRREEAEAALKAPDAVMGNRFIKLFWANRDSVPDDGTKSSANLPITPWGVTVTNPVLPHPSVPVEGKKPQQSVVGKEDNSHGGVAQVPQKKLESLVLLKEEIRKKAQLLEQKQKEFKQQLDKFKKQATGGKDVVPDQASEKLSVPELAKGETSGSSPKWNASAESSRSIEHDVAVSSAAMPVQAPSSLKPSVRPLAPPVAPPFLVNRFKLDNRPTAFQIIPSLPAGLRNVSVLEEHFSRYGDLSSVELEESEPEETGYSSASPRVSARICFTTRRSAEKAFSGGKSWQGHKLQFMWLRPNGPVKDTGSPAKPSSSSNKPSESSGAAVSQKSVPTGSGEENPLGGDDAESINQDKDRKSSSTTSSDEKHSP